VRHSRRSRGGSGTILVLLLMVTIIAIAVMVGVLALIGLGLIGLIPAGRSWASEKWMAIGRHGRTPHWARHRAYWAGQHLPVTGLLAASALAILVIASVSSNSSQESAPTASATVAPTEQAVVPSQTQHRTPLPPPAMSSPTSDSQSPAQGSGAQSSPSGIAPPTAPGADDQTSSVTGPSDPAEPGTTPVGAETPPPDEAEATQASTAEDFANCSDMHDSYPHGVGRSGAVDHTRSGKNAVTNFYVSDSLYSANSESDADGDGVACEKH